LEWLVPPTSASFLVDCYQGSIASADNTVILSVSVSPQFTSTISKTLVKGGSSYELNIATTNIGSSIGISKINITYAGAWTFNSLVGYSPSTWTVANDATHSTFTLTDPNILTGSSASIVVNMTSPLSTTTSHWNSTAWDTGGAYLGVYDLPIVVDAAAPNITYASRRRGKKLG